jgi:hypothetical protein
VSEKNEIQRARELGFPTREHSVTAISNIAARTLPADSPGVAISVSGNVTEVLTDTVPNGDTYAALTRAAGMSVTVILTTPELLAQARSLAAAIRAGIRDVGSVTRVALNENPNVTQILLQAGKPPHVFVAHSAHPSRQSKVTTGEFHAWREALGSGESHLRDGENLWLFTAHKDTISCTRLTAAARTPAEMGMPTAVRELLGGSRGIILVGGKERSGKTSAGASLCLDLSRNGSGVVTITDSRAPEIPGEKHDAADARIADVIFLDSDDVTATLTQAVDFARRGKWVIVTLEAGSESDTLARAAEHIDAGTLAELWSGTVYCTLLNGVDSAVAAYATISATPVMRALIRTSRFDRVNVAVEAAGSSVSVGSELALANTVRSGRVRKDVARAAARDKEKFDLSLADFTPLADSENA